MKAALARAQDGMLLLETESFAGDGTVGDRATCRTTRLQLIDR